MKKLSKDEMKKVIGGLNEGDGTCTVTVTCPPQLPGTVSCSGQGGDCHKDILWVQCDEDPKIFC